MGDCAGQLSIFDLMAAEPDIPKLDLNNILTDIVKRGTGFVRGKERVRAVVNSNIPFTEKLKKIKDEYGIGGSSWPQKEPGLHSFSSMTGKGIDASYIDESRNDVKVLYSWTEVVKKIETLISNNEY